VVLPDGLGSAGFENVLTGESVAVNGNVVVIDEAFRGIPWAAFKG
jgi:(1->4)-alpha-D-glucan 1-alpha-D-glucosylmutase